MRDENSRPDLVEQRRDRVGDHRDIERSGVGRHRAEVLIERLGVLRELNAREVVRPKTDPEHAEPQLLVGRRRDGALDHAAPRVAAARLIDHVDGKAAAQKDVLIALAPVRRGLPCLRELSCAVPEHERKLPRVYRDLIEGVGVIAAVRLARGRGRLERIKDAGALRHRPADRKAALLLNDQRCRLCRFGCHCAWRSGDAGCDEQQRARQFPLLACHAASPSLRC